MILRRTNKRDPHRCTNCGCPQDRLKSFDGAGYGDCTAEVCADCMTMALREMALDTEEAKPWMGKKKQGGEG